MSTDIGIQLQSLHRSSEQSMSIMVLSRSPSRAPIDIASNVQVACGPTCVDTSGNPFLEGQSPRGRPTVISKHCRLAQEQGKEECLWLCVKRGRRFFAVDIPLRKFEGSWGFRELRNLDGWWKRYSLFLALGVKGVKVCDIRIRLPRSYLGLSLRYKIRFLGDEKLTEKIEVVVTDFDLVRETAQLDLEAQRAWQEVDDGFACGVDSLGRRHGSGSFCGNEAFDEQLGGTYCKTKHVSDLSQQKSHCQWLPSMLEYFWQNGIGEQAEAFLGGAGFVYSYRYAT